MLIGISRRGNSRDLFDAGSTPQLEDPSPWVPGEGFGRGLAKGAGRALDEGHAGVSLAVGWPLTVEGVQLRA